MMDPVDASLAFLRRWHGPAPRVLTAIEPDRGYIRTRGFAADDEAGAREFIREWRGRRGLYFAVNPDLRVPNSIAKKGRKEDVARVVALHADLDSYKEGEGRDDGKARVLAMLADPPFDIPGPPSVINDSGNGIQCFWLLREPVEVDGVIERAEAVERYNRGVAEVLGADRTTDISRIMRLPWAVNLPNEGKRARGLVPVLSRQVLFEPRRIYHLSEFPASDGKDSRYVSTAHESRAARIQIGDPEPISDLDRLQVPAHTKALIAVAAPPGYRSERVRKAILSMIGCGESNETILGVLTDPRWAISESVIEKDDPDAYARRQIVRAHAWLTAQREGDFDDE